jgi:hypothetical protein
MSSKTTFQERFERTSKFYDNIYHHHKATFKGLAEFFKNYYSIEKEYANSLIKLSSASTPSPIQSIPASLISAQNCPSFSRESDRYAATSPKSVSCISTMGRG